MKLYPMLIDDAVREQLADLAARAELHPVPHDRLRLLSQLSRDPAASSVKAAHMAQMTAQSLDIPTCYCVTYSIELQPEPLGRCRHMSLSITTPGAQLPHPVAVWEVATLLGFWGELCECDSIYPETLTQGNAINLVQRMKRPDPEKT
jgi:hypothetical protein